MNILWINKIKDTESWRTTQIELTKSLRKRGHNVVLIMEKNIGEKKAKNYDNVTYIPTIPHTFLSGFIFGLITAFYFPLIVRKRNTDLIMIDGTSIWLPFVIPLKLLRIPIILDIRTLPINQKSLISFDLPLYLSKYIMNGLTTITPELEDILVKKYGIRNKKIGIWPSGVSMENFIKSNTNNDIAQKLDSKKFVIIHHGSHGCDRGIENLIESIAELDSSLRKKTKLLLVGVPENNIEKYSELCKKIGVTEQVEILPFVEYKKIPAYIKSSDVGIIPLAPDKEFWKVSVPLKTLEYFGSGKPIIATSIPFHQRLFKKGKCGILIDSDSPKALSDAITYMYENKDKLDEMGLTGKEIVKSYYTWDRIACDIENFFKNFMVNT
ncbi:MAG: glycosyltransferase family 4 protein [Candidatus Thermoplasmatota archaeon]|nr:glycosyltransferase family 4 protein [Candidatus Thermoplasmatota archaeon]